MTPARIGCIADDYTGGTDVAAALRRQGLRTVLLFGPPADGTVVDECDAVVVALKSRALDAETAVKWSVAAHNWLVDEVGVDTVYFKYCSTFDSTPAGNIGPVTDALLDAAGAASAVVCPATPEHGRTVYQGQLFVWDKLLAESSMRYHPLTPMTDSDVTRLMAAQTTAAVGVVSWQQLRDGSDAVRSILGNMTANGIRHIVADALDDRDLDVIAQAVEGSAVVTGGAGLAGALGRVLVQRHGEHADPVPVAAPDAPAVVFAGSCSQTTLAQVDYAREHFASYRLDPRAVDSTDELLGPALAWLHDRLGTAPVMIYSSAPADQRGVADPAVAAALESTIGALAKAAVTAGARRVIVAGGETSGAVVDALGVRSVVVDAEADRGVPWCSTPDHGLSLLLKSGNFGGTDLLVRAATCRVLQ